MEFRIVGRRLPRCRIDVGAKEERVGFGIVGRRGPDAARRGTVLELVLAPRPFHDHRWFELLRLRANVVLPHHLAGLRIECHKKPATCAACVLFGAREELLQRAAAEHDLAIGHDRRGHQQVVPMRAWKSRRTAIDFPTLSPRGRVKAIHPAAGVGEVHGSVGNQRRAEDPRV